MADIELARAYVEIIPVAKGISQKTKEEVFPNEKDGERAAQKSGKSFSNRLGGLLKKSAIGVGIAAGGVLATSLAKGFGRLSSIENAEAKLRGLGNSATDVSSIMDNALAAVSGTAFGMDEAATTAAAAVAAGIKPGKDLEGYLGLVGDAATIAGVSMSDMGSIFNKVATSGKVQGDVFAQLGDKGIPIVSLLSEKMGVSAEEVYKLGAAGKVSTDDFLSAMSSMQGAALEGGNTTSGAFKNMGAALSRFGATLLGGVFPLIGPFFGQITALIDGAAKAVGPFLDALTPKMQAAANAALGYVSTFTESIGGILEVVRSGDFNPENWAAGVEEDSPLVGVAFAIRDAWLTASDVVVTAIGYLRTAFDAVAPYAVSLWGWFMDLSSGAKALFVGSGIAGGLAMFGKLGSTLGVLAGKVKGLLGPLGRFAPMLRFLGGPVGLIVGGLVTLIATNEDVRASFGNLLEVLGGAIGSTLETLVPVVSELAVAMGPVLAAAAVALGQALQAAAPVIVTIVNGIAGLIEWLSPALPLIVGVGGAVFGLVKVFGVLAPIFTTVFGVVAKVIGVVTKIGPLITALTGPVGWIVLAVGALSVALWAFFTKTETGRQLWAKIWGGIKAAVAAVVDWITGTAWPAIQAAWDGISAGAVWLYQNAILPAWSGIQTAIGVVGGWITGTLVPALQTAWNGIAAAAMWLWQNVIAPAWEGIRIAIAVVVTAVGLYVDLLKWYFANVIAPVALWLWQNVITPAWQGIQAVIGAVVAWVRDTGWPILKAAWDAIAAAATWLWQTVLKPAWDGIQAAIANVIAWVRDVGWPAFQLVMQWIGDAASWLWNNVMKPAWSGIQSAISAVVAWFRDTAWPIMQTVIGYLKNSFEGWKTLAGIVWDAVKTSVRVVADWLTNTAWPTIRNVIDRLKDGFATMRDRISDAWSAIRNKIIEPVAAWFRDTIKPLFDTVTGGVGDAFSTLRDTVEKVWNGIRDKAKEPVRFVVEDIVRDGIVKKYNEVAKLFKVPTIDEGKFKVGWATGGYTGPGAKYAPAGVVHADEFVIRKESQNSIRNAAPGYLDALNRHGAAALGGYATGGRVLHSASEISSIPHEGMTITSTYRAGARTAGTGSTSLHALGRAVDFAGTASAMRSFFNYVRDNFRVSELIHTPMGGRQLSRGGIPRSDFPAKTKSMHYNHVHVGGFANGEEPGDSGSSWWNPFDGLWDSLKDKVRQGVGEGPFADMMFAFPENVIGSAVSWAKGALSSLGEFATDAGDTVAGAARWTGVATEALAREGQFGPKRLAALLARMKKESGFDPRAINNWDSNAKRGTPSKGLMQVIQPTFDAYRDRSLSSDIYDPLANIVASIRYTLSRYGDLEKGWGRAGGYFGGGLVQAGLYDNGGWLQPGGVAVNLSNRPEPVFNGAQWDTLAKSFEDQDRRGRFGDINVTVPERPGDDPTTFGRRVGESLDLHLLTVEVG